jgi:cell division protease FtsH
VEYGEHEEHVFLGRDIGRPRGYSEETAQEIDREVRKLIDDAYARAVKLITERRDKLEAIAKALLEFETLDGSQVRDIVENGRMRNPPAPVVRQRSEPPPLENDDTAPGFPPGLTEQPA